MSSVHPLLRFTNEELLQQALTHSSYANENPHLELTDNERLEFLGDAILNFLSGQYLYRQYPPLGEDQMTRRRAALVDEKQLAQFALAIGLANRMRLGRGAIYAGGFQNENLLSSTFEAVVGAYFLDQDGDVEQVRPLVEQLFESVPLEILNSRSTIDVKNRFQEWVQANIGPMTPKYRTERVGGFDHAPEFTAQVYVNKTVYGEGRGSSKKAAEKQAAENALLHLSVNLD
ncbi:MAG: ribonuclease III [Microcoleaceae cyanobacterium]